jgi:hypothetical protein
MNNKCQMSKLKVQMKSKCQIREFDKKDFVIYTFGIYLAFGF